jgi:hypothetical protein
LSSSSPSLGAQIVFSEKNKRTVSSSKDEAKTKTRSDTTRRKDNEAHVRRILRGGEFVVLVVALRFAHRRVAKARLAKAKPRR